MVATTEGNTSSANFVRYFSMSGQTPGDSNAGTLRHIKGSTASDRWQFGKRLLTNISRLQLDFQEHDLGSALLEHVMFDAGLAEIGFSDPELGFGPVAIGRHDGHFARRHGNDHIIHLVDVMSGGAARRQPPLGDADLGGIDLNFGFGADHYGSFSIPAQGQSCSGNKYHEHEDGEHHHMDEPEQNVGSP